MGILEIVIICVSLATPPTIVYLIKRFMNSGCKHNWTVDIEIVGPEDYTGRALHEWTYTCVKCGAVFKKHTNSFV